MGKVVKIAATGMVVAGIGMFLTSSDESHAPVDPEPLTSEQEGYCDRVDQWHREEMLGIDASRRWGSPDTKGTYAQWCMER